MSLAKRKENKVLIINFIVTVLYTQTINPTVMLITIKTKDRSNKIKAQRVLKTFIDGFNIFILLQSQRVIPSYNMFHGG